MKSNSDFLVRLFVTCSVLYAAFIGATFNGILIVNFRLVGMILVTTIFAVWLTGHITRRWLWFRTPLDRVFILWGLAFGLSLLANVDVWRRIAIGLWFVVAYIGLWFILQDILANQVTQRETLIDGVLIGSLIVVYFGFVQIFTSLPNFSAGRIPTLTSTLGNPNFFGGFLTILIPLVLGRLTTSRGILIHILLGFYVFILFIFLLLTNSRGAWLGLATGFVFWMGLLLIHYDLLSIAKLRLWWHKTTLSAKVIIGIVLFLALVYLGILAGQLTYSLQSESWETGRGELFQAALAMFQEKPLTGYGLFTYGREVSRFISLPPGIHHKHAHNILFHIAAELGAVGLTALLATVWVIFKIACDNWRAAAGRQRLTLASGIFAVVAFAIHHLTDVPAMMPLIAFMGVIALVLVMSPIKPVPFRVRWHQVCYPIGIGVLFLGLIISGFWSFIVYRNYVSILEYAAASGDFRGGAEQMAVIVTADPDLGINRIEEALLWGLAAVDDPTLAERGIEAYQQVLVLEPTFANNWANLAALQWQAGRRAEAVDTMREAVKRAPDSWALAFVLGMYAEAIDNTDSAREAYGHMLDANPDASLYPGYGVTDLQREITVENTELSPQAQVAYLLKSERPAEALQLWEAERLDTLRYRVQAHAMRCALSAANRNPQAAMRWQVILPSVVATSEDKSWFHLCEASMARFNGHETEAEVALEKARQVLILRPLDSDYGFGIDINQFLRTAIPRQFLPQVNYVSADPVLLYLLEDIEQIEMES